MPRSRSRTRACTNRRARASIVAERNRLALDLHDAVSQKLFGLVLGAETASTLLDRDPAAAREQLARLRTLAQEARDELRSLVFELRPANVEQDGLGGALSKHVELLRRLQQRDIRLEVESEPPPDPARTATCCGSPRRRSSALPFAAAHVAVRLEGDNGRLLLEIVDDGVGFVPARPPFARGGSN